ncbi:hypothetical protein Bca4012_010486 [Brassica carinata]|uniref:Uncharacterized protein n=1 Tax=Brassica carinata TaxID=52824 RepID=A0A8X7V1N9_BRACI|nr:hypothetical protein Bca52824_035406 [Brassica carinata]
MAAWNPPVGLRTRSKKAPVCPKVSEDPNSGSNLIPDEAVAKEVEMEKPGDDELSEKKMEDIGVEKYLDAGDAKTLSWYVKRVRVCEGKVEACPSKKLRLKSPVGTRSKMNNTKKTDKNERT